MELDLHVHSKYSFDSVMKVDKIINVALKRGLNGIAITDHNEIKGSLEAIRVNKDPNFIVIPASEISTSVGEIIGYFITDKIKPKDAFEVIDEIKRQDGIAVLAHPYKRMKTYPLPLIDKLDAIEGLNARIRNKKNLKMAWNLAKKYHLPMTAGSDAHFYFEIGRGICIIENASDIEDIKREITRGKTKITGTFSSPHLEPLSQLIRAFKTMNPKLLFSNVFLESIFITYQIVKEATSRDL